MFFKFFRQIKKRSPDLTGVAVVAIATLCTAGLAVGVREFGGFQRWELMLFDRMMQWRASEPPDPRILIVAITEQDIQKEGEWPVSDRTLARAIDKLQQYDPAVIGLDIYRDLAQPPGHQAMVEQLAAENLIAIRNDFPGVNPPPSVPEERISFNDLITDPDGPIRRSLITFVENGQTNFSLALKLAMTYLEERGLVPQPNPNRRGEILWGKAVLNQLSSTSGAYTHIDDQGYQLLINYRSPENVARQVTLSEVESGYINPEWVKDKIVLIGTIAPSIGDLHYTPYSPAQDDPFMAGVVIHAQMTSQILSAVLDGRGLFWFWPNWAEWVWIIGWAAAGGTMAWVFRHPIVLSAISGIGEGALLLISWGIFTQAGWVPVVTPGVAFAIAAGGVVAYRAYQAGRQQQMVMKLLGQSTSREIADALWENRDRLLKDGKLPGQKSMATMLFTDLKNFSTISEQMPPEALMEWLNEYLDMLTQVVEEHHGIINKFTGDGIMAAFGVPIPRQTDLEIAEDARNAVNCGLAMGDRLGELNLYWQQRGLPVIQMRVGIFTGPVVAGSLGGKDRQEYGIIGDSVNIASRLESCEKDRQSSICRVLIAEETLVRLPDEFVVEPWGPLALKGRQETVDVYRVICRQETAPAADPSGGDGA
ncbi:CHASE2 domain-containing protein [Phormidium sp. CCY1219]|uniref:CHASE2 domain-containing protein n=1 Tax=Phormidium sp. CCY1219 TaxID=2886104 RepID=UPI002D1EE745|nr:adenylate/guanylate cyclase domain-containing protein [Phormidium sp. CCY1219]MEB3827002.1 adenylate/guanylate cyclase domain-containing protein [Phormidium sp. CCY1219]